MNTLNISKDIYTALTEDNHTSGSGSGDGDEKITLYSYIKNRVFPIVAEEGTIYPFVTYNRTNITSSGCKCGIYEDTVSFSVNILTTDYITGLDIGNLVRSAIEKRLVSTIEGYAYSDIRLDGAGEQFTNEGYIQTLNFTVKVSK